MRKLLAGVYYGFSALVSLMAAYAAFALWSGGLSYWVLALISCLLGFSFFLKCLAQLMDYRFALALKPGDCVNVQEYFRESLRFLRDHTIYRKNRIKWDFWLDMYAPTLSSMEDADQALKAVLIQLGDPYASHLDASQMRAFYQHLQDHRGLIKSRVLGDNIGYVWLKSFMSNWAATELEPALKSLSHTSAIILDLRDNLGGRVDEANLILSMFMPEGEMSCFRGYKDGQEFDRHYVLTKDAIEKREGSSITKKPRKENYLQGRPLVILVNANSASASELVIGVLRDHKLAQCVGQKTYGKGIAQDIKKIKYGAGLYFTTHRVYYPLTGCIQGQGLQPDYTVTAGLFFDTQLQAAQKLILSQLAMKKERVKP